MTAVSIAGGDAAADRVSGYAFAHGAEADGQRRDRRRRRAELVGEVVHYEDKYLLCYVRSPEGFIVALAEELS